MTTESEDHADDSGERKRSKEAFSFIKKSLGVPESVSSSRLAICKNCEFYTSFRLCEKCKCLMPVKVLLRGTQCPEGKWSRFDPEKHKEMLERLKAIKREQES